MPFQKAASVMDRIRNEMVMISVIVQHLISTVSSLSKTGFWQLLATGGPHQCFAMENHWRLENYYIQD